MTKILLNELEKVGNELVNYSKVDISNQIMELKNLPKQFNWDGPSSVYYVESYEKKMNKLIRMNNNLAVLAEFLLSANSNYSLSSKKVNQSYNDLMSELKDERE